MRVWVLFLYILLLSRLMQFLNGFMTITGGSGLQSDASGLGKRPKLGKIKAEKALIFYF